MPYLGNQKGYICFILSDDSSKLSDYPKPVDVEKIPHEILEKLLLVLNEDREITELTSGGKSSRRIYNTIKEADEISISEGASGNCVSSYKIFYGKTNEHLEKDGPYFRSIDGRTEGFFKHLKISPKTDIAIIIRRSSDISRIEREIYFLRKDHF